MPTLMPPTPLVFSVRPAGEEVALLLNANEKHSINAGVLGQEVVDDLSAGEGAAHRCHRRTATKQPAITIAGHQELKCALMRPL
ncbi:hypothetical protein G6F50_015266 [Rhizopus delemar]|uniref:Uncharacterized protein n=1 Tax=Rhizopus delemar TaxID=936053 RepID=A0A9P7C550_9FUNG|nr:hypothetical protein G6F50_015266 [Rhizopus delemar]